MYEVQLLYCFVNRIGSLIVDYKIHGTDKLNNETVNNTVTSSFEKQPGISISKNGQDFSGAINPQSLQLKGKNDLLS